MEGRIELGSVFLVNNVQFEFLFFSLCQPVETLHIHAQKNSVGAETRDQINRLKKLASFVNICKKLEQKTVRLNLNTC